MEPLLMCRERLPPLGHINNAPDLCRETFLEYSFVVCKQQQQQQQQMRNGKLAVNMNMQTVGFMIVNKQTNKQTNEVL